MFSITPEIFRKKIQAKGEYQDQKFQQRLKYESPSLPIAQQ